MRVNNQCNQNVPVSEVPSFLDRVRSSWRYSLSVERRYDIASAVCIFGVTVFLIGTGLLIVLGKEIAPVSSSIKNTCFALGISAFSAMFLFILVGVIATIAGVFLFPSVREEFRV